MNIPSSPDNKPVEKGSPRLRTREEKVEKVNWWSPGCRKLSPVAQ